jgi:hypothetical protein
MMSRIDSRHWTISTGCYFQNGHHNIAKNQHCPISSQFDIWVDNDVPNWRPFWKWRPVEMFQCRESIQDIIIYPHMKFLWYRTMLNFCGIVVAILEMATSRNCSMHNIAKNQHCPISSQFDIWVDNDVPNWFATLNNFYWLLFSKWWRPVEMFQCRESIQDIIIYPHIKLWWYRTMLIFLRYCGGHFENSNQ